MVAQNLKDIRKRKCGENAPKLVEWECLACGKKRELPYHDRKKKYCSQLCYRTYMAGRFDRWMASPQTMALPQSYDEFMLQEELPCLVDGCDWVGMHLSNHVNFTHGITAAEFKRAAGFNLSTGLVTPELHDTLSDRAHIHVSRPMPAECITAQKHEYIKVYHSLEGKEHHAKAQALQRETVELPERKCRQCGKMFKPSNGMAWGARYCNTSCRSKYYFERSKKHKIRCCVCNTEFLGERRQYARYQNGLAVVCSIHCRQIRAGKIARGTWVEGVK
jgi:hypothetical protein